MRFTAIALLSLAASLTLATLSFAQDSGPPALEPIRTVTIGENREFLVNGKPFLPIMSWAQSPKSFKLLRSVGMNSFAGRDGKEVLEAAKEVDGYVIMHFNDETKFAIGDSHLLGWIHRDEPDMPQKSQQIATPDQIEGAEENKGGAARKFEPKEPPAVTIERYEKIKQADKSRPVFLTFTGHFTPRITSHYGLEQKAELYPQYIKVADVVGFDIYPIYGHGRPGWLNRPADGVAELRELAGPGKPVYAWIETHKGSRWMTYEKQPDVLPVHTRYQVWGCLIQGATGIGYFTHAWRPVFKEFAPTAPMQAELARLNGQITQLAPAILAAPAKVEVSMTMSDELDCHFKATEHDKSLYIFAQNRDLGPNAENLGQFQPINPRGGKATFKVAGLKAGTKVEVVDEERAITAVDGGFNDDFAALAEHIYRIAQ